MSELGLQPREHLDLLYQASVEFNSTLEIDELLPRVFDRAMEILDAEAGSIWLRKGEGVICEIARGPVGEQIEGLELPLGAGIVGDIAHKGEPELVADARDDPRFVHQVDEATGFATRSMVAAPIRTKEEVLGVLQVLNKRSGSGQFDEGDMALLEGLGATAGLALRNAQLHEAERRARDLKALLGISHELTSTLEVDRLVLSVVNLGSQVLAYDRAAIALDEGGRPVLKAISGQEGIDPKGDTERALSRLVTWLVEHGGTVYVPDLSADDPAAAGIRDTFGDYLDQSGIRSLCVIPLEDEEGRLGAIYMESAHPSFLGDGGREAAELLAHQVAIALRNADLYGQVPFIGLLEPVAEWRRRIATMPRGRMVRRIGIPAAIVLLLLLIPWGERISVHEARLLPGDRMPLRATVGGLLMEAPVEEGAPVAEGDVLGVLRHDEIAMSLEEVEGAQAVAERNAASARSRGDEGAARIAEIQARQLSARLELLRNQLDRTRLQAPVDGVVLTRRPQEKLGEWLEAGQTFVVVGRTDRLELEGRVAQREIERVEPGQRVRLKVPARPDYTFVGTVTEIAPNAEMPLESEPTFVVRAALDNARDLLKPGMEAKAKIVGPRRPIGYLLLRPLVHWIQLRFWR